ncbi:sensor histidine kinase [Cyclobacterium jeungdonense]|uniref:histidine kinase n=1 Tax=Cyclobacterium jeungdonense TaxID=708087 RepID=A0ABT8CDY2_9BACT|nr:HAMP domain-containing sensor histidine kinase [Cyclobacterium jeungdonense]MDN3689788.1 HAMP domain-containing sensor histidine kinase [Cyclobacterium jeungdonense]
MSLSFQNRIAFHYLVATAIIMAVAFGTIFLIVKGTVIQNLDNDLSYEAEKHLNEIEFAEDSIQFINKEEWQEREHTETQVNPVFIQLNNKQGLVMDRSPNLKQDFLIFKGATDGGHYNAELTDKPIRQVQLPIQDNDEIRGYIIAAISSESAFSVITRLRNVLLASYFVILIGLYYVSRFLAGRSMSPIQEMTRTITHITQNNLNERVTLPKNQDEIFFLSSSFNDLLKRIEKAIEKEKQFTSDASHELRTPLATLRGTLEVLIRKPRSQQEYEEKILYSLEEIDRMTATLEQLLMLARLETSAGSKKDSFIPISTLLEESIARFKNLIKEKKLKINLRINQSEKALLPHFYSNIIVDNILNNAIKYSKNGGTISIGVDIVGGRIICNVKDEGIGIKEEDLNNIYDSFYRSDALNHRQIPGNGLGLAIAKKCANAIQAELNVSSTFGQGTNVMITF